MFSKLFDLADELAAGISRSSVQPGRRSFLRTMLEASGAVAAFLGFAPLSPAQAGNCVVAGGECTIGGVPCTATGVGSDVKTAKGRFQADLYNKCLAYCKSRANCGKSRNCCPYGPSAPNINCVTEKGQIVCTADEIYCWCECYPPKGMQCTPKVFAAAAAKAPNFRQGKRMPID